MGGRKLSRLEPDAGKAETVETVGQRIGVDPGGAELLERHRRASAFREIGPFKQGHAGVERRGF